MKKPVVHIGIVKAYCGIKPRPARRLPSGDYLSYYRAWAKRRHMKLCKRCRAVQKQINNF